MQSYSPFSFASSALMMSPIGYRITIRFNTTTANTPAAASSKQIFSGLLFFFAGAAFEAELLRPLLPDDLDVEVVLRLLDDLDVAARLPDVLRVDVVLLREPLIFRVVLFPLFCEAIFLFPHLRPDAPGRFPRDPPIASIPSTKAMSRARQNNPKARRRHGRSSYFHPQHPA